MHNIIDKFRIKVAKLVVALSCLTVSVYADSYGDFSKYAKGGEYIKACIEGRHILISGERDERLLSLIGKVCLKADFIDTVGVLQGRLRKSKSARVNAVIFSSIVLQKRLIYQFMYDNTDISTLALPISEHPLSYTFVAIRNNNYALTSKTPKVIEFEHAGDYYKVYIEKAQKGRVIIEVTDKNNITKIHRYL